MSTRRTVLGTSVAGLVGGAIILAGTTVGASAQPAEGAGTSGASLSGFAHRECGAVWKRLPAELRADLTAARALPAGEERRRALREIARDIRAGEYGERVRALAERRHELRQELRKRLPAQLTSDLRAVREVPSGERRAALATIWQDALAGEYGEAVQELAEHRKQRREECRPDRAGAGDGAASESGTRT